MSTIIGSYKANEVLGVKVLDPVKYHPLMFSWVQNLYELPVWKEVLITSLSLDDLGPHPSG